MKDLLVIVADADAEILMNKVLGRPEALGMRPIDVEVRRFSGLDPGVVEEGPELSRSRKVDFRHVILLWDHHGSNWESADEAEQSVVGRLKSVTWGDRCGAIAIQPELEAWLWHSPDAIREWLRFKGEQDFVGHLEAVAKGMNLTLEEARQKRPKELLEGAAQRRGRGKPLAKDIGLMASAASLRRLENCPSFGRLARVLRGWFPGQ